MSLEQAVLENTAAIRELIAALNAQKHSGCMGGCEKPAEKPATAPEPAPAVVAKVSAPVQQAIAAAKLPAEPVTAPAPEPTAETIVVTEAAAVTYDDVSNAITAMFKIDRNRIIATLAKFGVKKGPELDPSEYAAFIAELNA